MLNPRSTAVPVIGSQVSVREHGVLLPHSAEAFDGLNKLLIIHKL